MDMDKDKLLVLCSYYSFHDTHFTSFGNMGPTAPVSGHPSIFPDLGNLHKA